jgi:hypothetical protein
MSVGSCQFCESAAQRRSEEHQAGGSAGNGGQGATASLASTATQVSWNLQLTEFKEPQRERSFLSCGPADERCGLNASRARAPFVQSGRCPTPRAEPCRVDSAARRAEHPGRGSCERLVQQDERASPRTRAEHSATRCGARALDRPASPGVRARRRQSRRR